MPSDIKINYDMSPIKDGLLICPFFIGICALYFYYYPMLKQACFTQIRVPYFIPYALIILILIASVIWMLMNIIGIAYGIYFLTTKKTALILNEKGMCIDRYGFVQWKDIDDIFLYYVMQSPLKMLTITFKDLNAIKAQAAFEGKLVIFFSRFLERLLRYLQWKWM